MFKNLEVGRQVGSDEFEERALALREQLVSAQIDLASRNYPLIIIIAGLDGSGKGALVHRLNEWMDPRGISTNTYWEHSDEEESRPFFWRFWRKIPPRGETAIFLGSWYGRPALGHLSESIDAAEFGRQCRNILAFERGLIDDGAVIVKLWLHVSREKQKERLNRKAELKHATTEINEQPYEMHGSYKRTLEVAEELILATDTSESAWHLLEAEDSHYRDLAAGEIILQALLHQKEKHELKTSLSDIPHTQSAAHTTVLSAVDLSQKLSNNSYKNKLAKYQEKLQRLTWQAYHQKRSVIAVFEGWDAAGKGSSIRRVTRAIDPRIFHLVQFAAPTDEEKARHYLWRFWRQIERDGRTVIFDRSWYGRVLVERVEEFATSDEWHRAYAEINQFEAELSDHGHIICKFWLHISKEEQLARFKEREKKPHKRHKITQEDWRNRDKWDDYEQAVDNMISKTSTSRAPWTVVAADDKRFARICVLKTICQQLEAALQT